MADFQTASAAIGLVGDVVRLVLYLKEVKAALDTVDDDIDGLVRELESLKRLYQQLEQEYTQQPHQGTLNARQEELWSLLRLTLDDGRKNFTRFDRELRKVYGGDPKSQGWLDAFKKQHRLRSRLSKLGEFHKQLQMDITVLQAWFSIISLTNRDQTRDFERDAASQLQGLQDGISSIQERLEESEQHWGTQNAPQTFSRASVSALEKVSASLRSYRQGRVNKHFDIPNPVDPCYIGREQEASKLADGLFKTTQGQPGEQKRFVVHGVGGSGKTQFCCKFAQDHRQRFWGVFWIDGRSHDQLKQTLSDNVAAVGKVAGNHKAALNWLTNLEETWLLIIDNADDPTIELSEYFPKGSGYILITTRNPGFHTLGTIAPFYYKFNGMRNDEANALLFKTAGLVASTEEVTSIATRIVKSLGYLALAITVAGKQIGAGICRIQDYLEYLENKWQERRRLRARDPTGALTSFDEQRSVCSVRISFAHRADKDDTRENKVETTFDISYQAIAKIGSQESNDALQMLRMFAFLHCENIRYEFLEVCVKSAAIEQKQQAAAAKATAEARTNLPPMTWSKWAIDIWIRILTTLDQPREVLPDILRDGRKSHSLDKLRLGRAMAQLTQYSLAMYNPQTSSWSMHPLVHKWAREVHGMSLGEQHIWCHAAATLLCSCVSFEDQNEKLMRQLLPHIDAVKEEQAKVEKRMRDHRMARTTPWPIFEPGFSRQRAIMMAKYSMVYFQNGRYKEAEELQKVVQRFTVKVLGFDKPNTRRITLALSGTLWHLGRGDDSAKLLEELVQACNRYCGPMNRETLIATQKLGDSRWLQGRVSDAIKLYQEALAGLKEVCDPDDDDILSAMDSLGGAIILFGTEDTYSQARDLHRATFEARKKDKDLGPSHLKTLTSRELFYSAATWGTDREALIEAEKGLGEIIAIRKEVLGREHAFTLLAMLNLARVKVELEKFDAAQALLDEGLPIATRNLGENHTAVLFGRFHVGRMWVRQKRWLEARDILVDVTERQKTGLQGWRRFHLDRIGALVELAKAHNALGEHDKCDETVEEALTGFQKVTSVPHPWALRLRATSDNWKLQRSQTGG